MKQLIIIIISLFFSISLFAQLITPEFVVRADMLLKQMTLDEKIDYISGYNEFYIRPVARLGIPAIKMSDGPQGLRNDTKSTLFPCGILSTATWNRTLLNKLGIALGQDSRARGVHILLGPGVNIYRAPMCGRNFEYFGEDPYLAGELAVEYIKGVQSQGVISTVKHFAGNNQEWNRHHVSSDIDERTLHEIYFPAFEKAVREAHVGAVMNSYNLLNSVHTTENKNLNVDILRDQWGFKGILMSDWESVYSTVGAANGGLDLEMPSGRFMNKKYLLPAIQNGIVLEQTINEKVRHILETIISFGFLDRSQKDSLIPEDNPFSNQIALDLAREGVVLLKNTDNILPVRKKEKILILGPNAVKNVTGGGSGFVEPFSSVSVVEGMKKIKGSNAVLSCLAPIYSKDINAEQEFFTDKDCNEAGFKVSYYNNETFSGEPLVQSKDMSIDIDWELKAPSSNIPSDHFSVCWTSVYRPKKTGFAYFKLSADDGYRLTINNEKVISHLTCHAFSGREGAIRVEAGKEYIFRIDYFDHLGDARVELSYDRIDDETLLKEIKQTDKVILCAGFNSNIESENSDRTFELPKWQEDLIDFTARHHKDVIIVLNAGGGVNVSAWEDKVKGLLMAWYPGQQGGAAIAEILTGKISPSGKLPISVEKKWEDNPVYDSYYANPEATLKRVQYKEGIFVGYRGYDHWNIEPRYPFGFGLSYTTFQYENFKIEKDEVGKFTVSFDIKNTGKLDASEIAQVYVGHRNASIVVPPKELKGFDKVFLKKGETKRLTISLMKEAFSHYDVRQHKFLVEPGQYEVMVGKSSRDIVWKQMISL